tara:strand:- start:1723 stop:1998 length:276 start_codon:yes stop_codon:yes gene_type:complete
MTYEDIEAEGVKRAEQEASKEAQGKRKRGRPKRILVEVEAEAIADKRERRKRQRATQEAEEALVAQTSGIHVAAKEGAPRLYRAPVARMWE